MNRIQGWGSLLGAVCLLAGLPVHAADAPRSEAAPPAPSGPQVRTIVRTVIQRVMLGMAIDMREAGPGGEGVRVLSVSPGGAAEAAGLRADDVVVSLDGKALRGTPDHPAQQQLLDIVRAAKPDVAIAIEYRRDGKSTKTQITPKTMSESMTTQRLPDLPNLPNMPSMPNMPNMPAMPGMGGPDAMHAFHFAVRQPVGGGFGGTQLVPLTPALGSYFGTEKGMLVLRAPQDARFKLQDGDVIVDIDGRVPTEVSHAFQILDSYRPGETVKLRVLRQKKRLELAVEIPQPPEPQAPANRGTPPLQRMAPGAAPQPPAGPAATSPQQPNRT